MKAVIEGRALHRGSPTRVTSGPLAVCEDTLGCHGWVAAMGISWVETKDATKHHTMYRTDPTTKSHLARVSVVVTLENLGPEPFFSGKGQNGYFSNAMISSSVIDWDSSVNRNFSPSAIQLPQQIHTGKTST